MKKVFVLVALFAFAASAAFGQTWKPTKLELSAPDEVYYNFDGNLSIDVNVSGTPSKTVFCVFTKDQAGDILNVQNGYLGWHYVNKVDTCIYYTKGQNMQIGANTITWNGTDMDGNDVEAGEYYYYLFGYDNVNFKQQVASIISIGCGRYDNFITEDYEGNPLAQPILYTDPFAGGGDSDHPQPYFVFGSDTRDGQVAGENVNRMKWVVGSDPDDASTIEKTWYAVYFEHAQLEPSPYAPDMFYTVTNDQSQYLGHMRRYTWVPNGESTWDMDFGDEGEVTWSILTNGSWWVRMAASFSYIGDGLLIGCNSDHSGMSTQSELPVVDAVDGYIVNTIDLADWWIRPDDGIDHDGEKGQQSSGPNHAEFREIHGMPQLVLTAHSTCLENVINPQDPDGDWQRWINGNGDYIADHNWQPDDLNAWVCNDYGPPARTYTASIDNDGFVLSSAYEEGAVSFHLFAPDGTGIDMLPYAGETAGPKYTNFIVQYDSAYDGIYCDNESSDPASSEWRENVGGVWYVGHDSMRGVITDTPIGVEEVAPAAFAVAQNSPNPFNPTTTISFSLADAGNVSIDVYNVAGQKIDTLVDSFMESGSHSVVWDAAGFSAGVYFYTVKAGDFSKTMKMTLLK